MKVYRDVKDEIDGFARHHAVYFRATKEQSENEINRWCFEAFGPPGFISNTHTIRWDRNNFGTDMSYTFRDESDVAMFMLRWA
jgi:hypothetical protein